MLPSILASLVAPNMSHVLFALGGALVGWWLKKHPDVVPAEFMPMVQALLARLTAQKEADAHATLHSVVQPTPDLLAAVEAAVAKGLLAMASKDAMTAAPVSGVILTK